MLQKKHVAVPGVSLQASYITFDRASPELLSISWRGREVPGVCVVLSQRLSLCSWHSRSPAHRQATCAAVAHQLLALCCAAGRLSGGPAESPAPFPRQLSRGMLLQALLMCHMVICANEWQSWGCSAAECFRPHVENTNKWHVFVSLVNKQCYLLTYT